MIRRTHLAVGLGLAVYFLPFITYKLLFIPIVVIASVLPDIDSSFSRAGSSKLFRPVQMVFKHRGFLHSYTFCVIISFSLAFFYPIAALPFFLGYASHLFLDSFTVSGIKPFWPLKASAKGLIKTGGLTDRSIFFIFLFVDLFLIGLLFV